MRLERFAFSSLRIEVAYWQDVVIDGGKVRKRRKKPSKLLRGARRPGHPHGQRRRSPPRVRPASEVRSTGRSDVRENTPRHRGASPWPAYRSVLVQIAGPDARKEHEMNTAMTTPDRPQPLPPLPDPFSPPAPPPSPAPTPPGPAPEPTPDPDVPPIPRDIAIRPHPREGGSTETALLPTTMSDTVGQTDGGRVVV